MDTVRNPFSPGAGNPPPELAGRTAVIAQVEIVLKRIVHNRAVQFPILVGLRGVGKTVLLGKARDIAEREGFIVIDLEAHEGKTLTQLIVPGIRKALYTLSFIEKAKKNARRGLRVLKSFLEGMKVKLGDIEISVEAEHGIADSGDLEADLPELFLALGEAAKAAERPIAIIIDELQYLSPKEFSALIMGMHKISQRSLPIAFIGAALPQILGLAGNSKSYSERLFTYPEIGALSRTDAKEAIVNPIEEEDVVITDAAVKRIMEYTQCYPYFIQQWSYESWNIAEGNKIEKSDVDRANSRSIEALDSSFFKVRFDRCTKAEKKYMRALAELGEGPHRSGDVAEQLGLGSSSIAFSRSSLIKKGMIYSPSYGYTAFTVPLFDSYMRRVIKTMD